MGRRRRKSKSPSGSRCHWCNREMKSTRDQSALGATKDHVHPKHLGGTKVVWACRACNNIKGGMKLSEWISFMHRNPEWWTTYKDHPNRFAMSSGDSR